MNVYDNSVRYGLIIGIIVAIVLIGITVMLGGCAQSQEKNLTIRGAKSVEIFTIGNDNTAKGDTETIIGAETSGMVGNGVPPITGTLVGRSLFMDGSVLIEDIEGPVIIRGAGNRNTEQDVPLILEKLFIPDDPFKE